MLETDRQRICQLRRDLVSIILDRAACRASKNKYERALVPDYDKAEREIEAHIAELKAKEAR